MLIPFTSASFTNLSGLAVADGAEVEVRLELNGALAALFDDRAGTTPLTNPFNADSQGRFEFYVAGRIDGYSIQVTKGAQTHTLRHQLTASAAATLFDNTGTGLLAESVQDAIEEIGKRWTVHVTDYLSAADLASFMAGSTVAIDTALNDAATYLATLGGGVIHIPSGNVSLNNYRPKTDIVVKGDGYDATTIHQAVAGNPAYNALSDATTGQLIGIGLIDVKVFGHPSATVAAVKLDATAPFVITRSKFDYVAHDTYQALHIPNNGGGEVYNNVIKVVSDITESTSVLSSGSYNRYDFFLTNCMSGVALSDLTGHAVWDRVVADGQLNFDGASYTVDKATVEGITGTSLGGGAVIRAHGNFITMISPAVKDVPNSKAEASFSTQNNNVWITPVTFGSVFPNFPFYFQNSPTPVIVNANILCVSKLNGIVSAADLALATFIGDCSSILFGDWPPVAKLRYPTIPVGSVAYGSLGTSTTGVSGTIYLAEVRVDATKSITGIGVLNGPTVGTNVYVVALFDSSGTFLKQSDNAITAGANAFQDIPLQAAVAVTPGRYWIGLQINGTTDRFRTIAANTFVDVLTKSSAGSFGAMPDQTVPTTFTADVGPIAYLY